MTEQRPAEVIAPGVVLPDSTFAGSSGGGRGSLDVFGRPYVNSVPLTPDLSIGQVIGDPVAFAKSLDGEFCIVLKTLDRLLLISDRFVSRPLFYTAQDDRFVYTFSYSHMWEWLRNDGTLRPDRYAFYEFLKFQRLFGDRTLDHISKMLPPSTVLTFDKNTRKITSEKYWSPDFEKRGDSATGIAGDLADTIRQSLKAKTGGIENVGLLLSGGMDSRVVLGAFDRATPPNTFTVGATENNEVKVARELAEKLSAPHYFVERSPTHYADILPTGVSGGGAMYTYQHGHFFGLKLPAQADLLVHGHGLDYMFQGMYLPSRRKSFLGRPTRNYGLVFPGQVVDEYIESAKYRLKGIDPSSLLQTAEHAIAEENVRDSIETVAREVQDVVAEPFDLWDHLTFGWPGRHYTYLNIISAGSLAPQRTVAWDNTIFDLFYATPARVRFGTRLLAATLKVLRPELLEVRNANTNLSPKLSGTGLTVAAWRRGLMRRAGLTRSDYPSAQERSWPTNDQVLANSNSLLERARGLSTSNGLLQLDLFDSLALQRIVGRFETGQSGLGSAILSLLTIDEFLSAKS